MNNNIKNGRLRVKPAMTGLSKVFIILLQITVSTGCVKETLFDTNHPNHAKITLSTGWDDRGEGIAIPADYTVVIGDYSTSLQGPDNSINNLFAANTYNIYVYNVASNIAVNASTSPVIATANYPAGEIGWLFTGTETASVEKDKDCHIAVAMHQQVRQLTLELEITGNSGDRITGIDATLSGVAGAINIENGNPEGNPVTVAPLFTQTDGKYSATIRLLGVAGIAQILSLTLHFDGGNPSSITVTADLADRLAAFNANRKTPLTLRAGIATTVTPLGLTAEISDWEDGNSETVIAN